MKIFNKKTIRTYFGLIIGLIFIAFILKNIDIHKSIEAVKHLNFVYVVLMIPLYYSSFLFRALRWKAILAENKKIKLNSFLNSILRGWAVNSIVPARGGEIYRAHHFGKKENLSRITILASIVLERIFDGIVLFLILFFLVSFVYSNKKLFGVAVVAGIVFVGVFSGLLLISKFYKNTFIQEKFCSITAPLKKYKIFHKINSLITSFMTGLDVFNAPVLILKAFLFTILVWLCEGATLFLLIKGFGYSIGLVGSLFVLSIVAFVSLIPGGPAALGPLQWGFIMALGFFKVSHETAFAVSIVSQIFSTSFVFIGSLIFVLAEHFNLKKLKEENYTFGS